MVAGANVLPEFFETLKYFCGFWYAQFNKELINGHSRVQEIYLVIHEHIWYIISVQHSF